MTVQGYTYQVSLDSPGITTATTFTTDDGSGTGGTTIDAPPGQELLTAKLTFTNDSGRQEPFVLAPTGALPDNGLGAELTLAVPQAEASSFGIPAAMTQNACGTVSEPIRAPAGYCTLDAVVGAFSPALVGMTQQPQLASGADGTITLLDSGPVVGEPIPESAPVSDVKLFVEKTTDCSGTASCWAAVD